ncbi:MAG: hypothetical protein NTY38_25220 [Acidobacteria bacterium]|nr:hypothetical protein [Acidobacteriota bacterium]
MTVKTGLFLAAFLTPILLLTSCASGPSAPEKGTPAFYWQAATETYAAANFLKASDHLESLSRSPNEFTARALPWRLVLTAGIAKGYMDLADNYEYGARANKTNPTPFRKLVSEYRTRANQYSLHFAETFDKFQTANKDPQIAFAFAFPTGAASQAPELLKAAQGIILTPDEADTANRRTLERAIILEFCQAVGAAGDAAKAQQVFASSDKKVARGTFLLAMAQALYDQSQLYESRKLDQPDRMKSFCALAAGAMKDVPESKASKELNLKIQRATTAAARKGKS